MALSEVIVRRGDRGPAVQAADDVSTRFEVVICEYGPVGEPIVAISKRQMHDRVGETTAYSTLRAADSYFDEGGTRVVLSRVVGPAAARASLALRDRDGGTVITVTAEGPGDWYHAYTITAETAVGSSQQITVKLDDETLVTGTVTSEDAAIDLINSAIYLRGRRYATAVGGAGVWPLVAVADRPLAGGDDDRANIRDEQVTAALTAFSDALGPGSVCASAWTSVAVHTALAQHARVDSDGTGYNRFARCDLPDVDSASTLIAHAAQIRALDDARFVQMLAGYPQVTIAGVTISVPPSGHLTGREARCDRENGPGPGQPCAQTFGIFTTAIGVSRSWSRSDMLAMKDAGITLIVQDPDGNVFAEDAITAVEPVEFPQYAEVAGMRVTMAIHNEHRLVLRGKLAQSIDGRGHVASSATKDLVGICAKWFARDALYGETAEEAFSAYAEAVITRDGRRGLVGNTSLRPTSSVQTVDMTITQVAAGDTI